MLQYQQKLREFAFKNNLDIEPQNELYSPSILRLKV